MNKEQESILKQVIDTLNEYEKEAVS